VASPIASPNDRPTVWPHGRTPIIGYGAAAGALRLEQQIAHDLIKRLDRPEGYSQALALSA
jgi:hypothetical protein